MNWKRPSAKHTPGAAAGETTRAGARRTSKVGQRAHGERGVTLAEILVVLAIMGLFIAVAVPALGNYIRASKVRSSNDTLVGDLRAARYIAITNRTTNSVTIDAAARNWTYQDIRGNTITRTLEQGTNFTSSSVTVTFKSDGSISTSPATIVMQGTVTTGVIHQFTISVSAVGRVSSAFLRL